MPRNSDVHLLRNLLASLVTAWTALVGLGERGAQSHRVIAAREAITERAGSGQPRAASERTAGTAEAIAGVGAVAFVAAVLANAALHA